MKTIIAIDPGGSGGIAWRNTSGEIKAVKMPDTEGDVIILLQTIRSECLRQSPPGASGIFAAVEVVGGFIRGNPAPGSAMFSFGRGYGFILGAFAAWGVPVHSVRPQEWQKVFGVGTKGERTTNEWKNHLKSKAQQLYPAMGVTLSTADALLILTHAIMVEGDLKIIQNTC